MLAARDLSVALSGRTIVSGIELTIRPGELVVVIGPNGAGKSTLLRALTGVLSPSHGEVTLEGRPLSAWSRRELAARRAVLAQSAHVAFPFTVFEVVALGRIGGAVRRSAALRALVLDCLAAVDLAGYEGRLYQQLSGGEQQRVQIARVLCQLGGIDGSASHSEAPQWLFLDEPTQSLDIGHQLSVLDVARRHADSGGGAFAILHDLNLASLYADRLIMLSRGRLVGAGEPAEVLSEERVQAVFGERIAVVSHGPAGRRYVLPVEASVEPRAQSPGR